MLTKILGFHIPPVGSLNLSFNLNSGVCVLLVPVLIADVYWFIG